MTGSSQNDTAKLSSKASSLDPNDSDDIVNLTL